MSEQKITRLRDNFLKVTSQFLVEQKLPENVYALPENQQIAAFSASVMKLDDLIYQMCNLGISGAKVRGVSSEEIERFMKESGETSKELRDNLIQKNIPKAMFLISQFQLLQRRIISSVANMLSPDPLYEFSKTASKPVVSKNLFIVHGKDDKPKLELARILEKLGFNAIILSEQPDKGRTIIEKLEEETLDVGYVFVILTPDDVVTDLPFPPPPPPFPPLNFKYRARQNVILELGYFVSKVGRNRVCCLYKGDLELPSDIHGVLFKSFDKSVEECYKGIVEELKAVGYTIKM
jgi:predicted nucleotide-binding protein